MFPHHATTDLFYNSFMTFSLTQQQQQFCSHKRTESFDFSKCVASGGNAASIEPPRARTPTPALATGIKQVANPAGMSPVLRKNIVMASQFRSKGIQFEACPQILIRFRLTAPSPRQRCRIRTNPWFSTCTEPEPFGIPMDFKALSSTMTTTTSTAAGGKLRNNNRDSCDSATSSSGIKSNSDESNEKLKVKNSNSKGHLSDSDSTSSTEKPNKTLISLTEFRRKYRKDNSQHMSNSTNQRGGDSDDDATLNEIGKFDESYVYEKENDFLR